MKKLNIVNITYFDKIDTEYKAYILGLIYADGTIDDKVRGKREWRLRISIQEEDKYVLQKLLDDTNKRKIIITDSPSKKINNWKKLASATVNNTYLCKSLIKLGCYPRKSISGMKFPNISENLIHHLYMNICIKMQQYFFIENIKNLNMPIKSQVVGTPTNGLETT